MENEVKTWLTDIKQAITEINLFLPDKKDFLIFKKDLKAKYSGTGHTEALEVVCRHLNYKLAHCFECLSMTAHNFLIIICTQHKYSITHLPPDGNREIQKGKF